MAVITALVAYLYGPGRLARGVRTAADRGTAATGSRALAHTGVRTGATGRLIADHRTWITGAVMAAGAPALVLWNHPTVGAVALVLGIALAVLIVLAVLAAAGPADRAAERATHQATP